MRNQLSALAALKAERNSAAEIATARVLVGLDLADALADPIALGFREGGGDGVHGARCCAS